MGDALPVLRQIARTARRRILARAAALSRGNRGRLLQLARIELLKLQPLLARTLKDAQIVAWLDAAKEPVRALALKPAEVSAEASPVRAPAPLAIPTAEAIVRTRPSLPENRTATTAISPGDSAPVVRSLFGRGGDRTPPPDYFPPLPDDAKPVVRFPQIEKAAHYLATRLDYTPQEFAELDDAARAVGFTVAAAQTLDAVEKIRKALVWDVEEGGTLKAFKETVKDALDTSAIADHQVEALYRTHMARAYSAGQIAVLDHPLITDEFPYLEYSARHDDRVRPDHLALETLGLNGTAVYRRDDPIWKRFYPPWAWNCRCFVIPLSIEDAAAKGVREAIRWVKTGEPPDVPEWVTVPSWLKLPKGWVPVGERLSAAL